MIELEMVFGLGFFAAGLLALACLPAVWRRALRLTDHRLRQLVPLSDGEIAAEQAGLRARFAVERRRLETEIEEVMARQAALMAALGRRDSEIAALGSAAARDAEARAELESEGEAARRTAMDLAAQMAAANVALDHAEILAEQRLHAWDAARRLVRDLEERVDRDRMTIAAFETRVLGLETRVADLVQVSERVTADLVRMSRAEHEAASERDAARRSVTVLEARRDLLTASVDRLGAEIALERDRADAAEQRATERTQAAKASRDTIVALKTELALRHDAAPSAASVSLGTDADLDLLREAIRTTADDILAITRRAASPKA